MRIALEEMKRNYAKLIGIAIVLSSMAAIAVLFVLDLRSVFEPSWLLPITNTIFAFIVPLIIVFYTARAYMKNGLVSVFLMGCGMLAFGVCAAIAGWLRPTINGANFSVTVYNTGAMLGALFHAIGGIFSFTQESPRHAPGTRKPALVFGYCGILICIILFTKETLQGAIPPFFIQASGPTLIRQIVLGLAIFFYALSAFFFMNHYVKKRSEFFYWYSHCMIMLSLGLFAVYLQKHVGSPIGWAGRISSYLGGIFSMIALWTAFYSGKSKKAPIEEIISNFFLDAEANYKSLVEAASDAIISFDQENRIIYWNRSAEQIFGHTRAEAIGRPAFGWLIPDEHQIAVQELAKSASGADLQKTLEIAAQHKNRTFFPIEVSAFAREMASGRMTTCIIRDITERKRAEEFLARQHAELQLVLDSSPAMIFYKDRENRFLRVNRAFAEGMGLPKEQLEGRSLFDLYPRQQAEAFWKDDLQVLSSGKPKLGIIEPMQTPAGARWVQTDKVVSRDAQGNSIGIIGFAMDITQRKKSEEKVRESEAKFRSLFEAMTEGVALHEVIYDNAKRAVDYRILTVNPAFEKHTGLMRIKCEGQLASALYGTSQAPYLDEYAKVAESGKPYSFETYFPPMNRYFYISAFSPKQGFFVTVFEDITERKQAEASLRESEIRYRNLVKHAAAGIYEVDFATGRFTEVNDTICQILGYTREEFLAMTAFDILDKEGIERFATRVRRMQAGQQPETDIEYRVKAKDGRMIWGLLNVTYRWKDGRIVGATVIATDITERKQMEEALRESEERLRRMIETSPVAIGFGDSQGKIFEANDSFYRLTGYTREEIQAGLLGWNQLTAPEYAEVDRQIMESLAETGSAGPYEKEYIRKDGTRIPLILSVSKFSGRDEHIAFIMDTTAFKKFEKALRESEERHRVLAETMLHGVVHQGSDGRIIAMNPAAERILGKTREQFLGSSSVNEENDTVREDGSPFPGLEHPAMVALRTGQPVRNVIMGVFNPEIKERRWIEIDAVPIFATGELHPAEVYTIFADITERKLMEELLRETRDYLENLFNYANAPIIVWDSSFQITRFNHAFERLTGLSSNEVIGKRLDILFPDNSRQESLRLIQNAMSGEYWEVVEIPILNIDGTVHTVLWNSANIYNRENTRVVATMAQGQDITERKQMEALLRKSRDKLEIRVAERTSELTVSNKALMEYAARLERLNQELQEFAFIASHDLQEPLRKIQIFSDLILTRYSPALDKTGQDYLNRLAGFADRMRQLLNDLLQFSRVTSRQEPFKKVALGKIIGEAAAIFEEDVKNCGGSINVESESLPEVEADEAQMFSLFQNLIGNAFKYRGKENPQIRIYAKDAGPGMCEVYVQDNGIGFEKQFAELIFKPFQRLHGRDEYAGTGMGLTICRKIVERHGATIRAESEPGKGSTFIIRLPLKQERI